MFLKRYATLIRRKVLYHVSDMKYLNKIKKC
jgi:hypothetical protein